MPRGFVARSFRVKPEPEVQELIFEIASPRFVAHPCQSVPSMPSRQDKLLRDELPKVRRHWIVVVTDVLTLVVVVLPFWFLGQ